MKKLFLLTALLSVTAGSLFAMDARHPSLAADESDNPMPTTHQGFYDACNRQVIRDQNNIPIMVKENASTALRQYLLGWITFSEGNLHSPETRTRFSELQLFYGLAKQKASNEGMATKAYARPNLRMQALRDRLYPNN